MNTEPWFLTRGVVLYPSDLSLPDWPARARRAGLTTLALHHPDTLTAVDQFIDTDAGRGFLRECEAHGIAVEYELHAMNALLPRALFDEDPSLFRMNDSGDRTPDANLCATDDRALEIVGERAAEIARRLRPTTGRYFLWGDDGYPGCRCPRCRDLSDSDQALLVENHVLAALRAEDPRSTLAHLAYAHTLPPPLSIRPSPGIFLEFAPIGRRHDAPFDEANPTQAAFLDALDANLALFGSEGAQALEYWLDASKFSGWKRPARRLPFDEARFADDLDRYARRGIRHITSFGAYLDADYVARYGDPPIDAYGRRLTEWRPSESASSPDPTLECAACRRGEVHDRR